MPVEFSNFTINDHGRPLTVENAFRFYGAFAGLHDFDFDRLYDLAVDGWQGVTGVTSVSMTGSSAWTVELDDTELPADHTVYFTSAGSDTYQGVVVGALDDQNYYLVVNEGSETFKVYKVVSGSSSVVLSVNFPYDQTGGDFTCSFRPFDTGTDERWLCITLWRDERHVLTYTEKLSDPLVGPYHFGLAAYSGNTRTYTNVYVPELTVYAEYGTLDPGEEAAGGLQRAIEGRYLKYFCRYDGTIRAFRPKTQTSKATLATEDLFSRSRKIDLRLLKTHVRMMGAYDWGEAMDNDLIAYYGHRFLETNNPMLMSENDCINEAERHLRRLHSEADTCELEAANLPLLEPEDRITEPEGDWIISGYSKEFVPGAIITIYSTRKYIEGS